MLWFSYISFYIPIKYIIGQDKQPSRKFSSVFDWLIMRGSFFTLRPPLRYKKGTQKSKDMDWDNESYQSEREFYYPEANVCREQKLDISTIFYFFSLHFRDFKTFCCFIKRKLTCFRLSSWPMS